MQENEPELTQSDLDQELVAWVCGTIKPWEDYRDNNFESDWEEYYQQWKGVWVQQGKTRDSERSNFISPALGQAIEMAVSEMEEATFSRKQWFDIDDDLKDKDKTDREAIRDQLLEDFELAGIPKALSEIYLNGAIYGTGIGKIVLEEKEESFTAPDGSELKLDRIEVQLDPVSPKEFCIDPVSRTINEGLGCACTPVKPKIDIIRKQEEGTYNDVPLGSFTDEENTAAMGEYSSDLNAEKCEIIEYHGLVPSHLLITIEDDLDRELAETEPGDDLEMTEAIVTIANRSALLKAVPNPFIYRDRSIIAYQHDTVPNRFWGRGVAEKGIHSQRALNAELRARQDGLALTIHPMMAIDATRVPRGFKPSIAPGKTLLANGDPRTVFQPMHFGDMGTHTYSEAGDLERMMQMATGSMDSATPTAQNARNNTMGGMSMIAAGGIKRSKRTMRNIEKDLLIPLIDKASWRYQQFSPDRYPFGDYKLLPYSTMGIMAREMEQQQIAQVLQSVPEGPAKGALILSFIANSSIQNKVQIEQAVQQQFQPPQPDPIVEQLKQLQLQNAMLENEKLMREIPKIESETAENYANAESKVGQTGINKFNAIAQTQDAELDRESFGREK